MAALRLVALILLGTASLHGQAEWPRPNWEKVEPTGCRGSGKVTSSTVGKYEVKIVPGSDASGDSVCRAYLVDRARKQLFLLEDSAVSIHQGTDNDIFRDGSPSLILEGFSGGAHCCYIYRIVNLSEPPVILSPIENQTPFFFFKDAASGQFRIMTSDGAFDTFDGLCHACTPFPRVVLRVDSAGLHDVSAQFVEQYDSEIALARAKIGNGDIAKFLAADFQDAKAVVLEIALAYLYSGRETQAWQTLDEMWPAADRERIRKLIIKTRAQGILSKLGAVKAAGSEDSSAKPVLGVHWSAFHHYN